MPTREQVNDAIFTLANSQLFNGAPFKTISRKFQHFSKVDSADQPALFQTEPSEITQQRTGMPALRTWHIVWTIYFTSDQSDPTDIPATRMNAFVDALEAVFPSDDPDNRQNLGGLVHVAKIEGETVKVAGDDDGQGLIIVPITIIVP